MRSTGKTTLNAKCHAQEFTAELHLIETHLLSWTTRTLYISTLCPGTYFGLIVTLHCVSLIPTHTEHTRIDYCIVEVVEMQKIRDVWTHILLHISPLLFSFSMSSCPFLFHTLRPGGCQCSWPFCLSPYNVTTFIKNGCPANSELGGGSSSSLQMFDSAEVKWEEVTQCSV